MEYYKYFDECIKETFLSMFDEEISTQKELPALDWITSKGAAFLIGITGRKKGRVVMDMSLFTAMYMALKLDAELSEENQALITLAEALNILSGYAITKINKADHTSDFLLTISSISSGSDSKIHTPNLNMTQLSYDTRFGMIDFYIGLEEDEQM